MAFATFIIMNWETNVKIYIQLFEKSCPDEYRIKKCPNCDAPHPHNHGRYSRSVHELNEINKIPVYRFQCNHCHKTFSLLPSFIGKHQQVTWDVQEKAYQLYDQGNSIEQVAQSFSAPIGPISSKTIWRWMKHWKQFLLNIQSIFWHWILSHYPSLSIPTGSQKPRTTYKWFVSVWKQVNVMTNQMIGLFQFLYKLHQYQQLE